MKLQNALTVAQLAELNPAISESTIRWWIFKAEEFGFSKCIIRFRRPGQARGRILSTWMHSKNGLRNTETSSLSCSNKSVMPDAVEVRLRRG